MPPDGDFTRNLIHDLVIVDSRARQCTCEDVNIKYRDDKEDCAILVRIEHDRGCPAIDE